MISVVLPTYNRSATLPRAIESVLAQTLEDWELLVVDDGSTDDTDLILARYDDSRVHVLTHEVNRGVTAAKNTGLDHVRGEWFVMLDSDDEMVPDALQTLISTAERTGALAVTCNCTDAQSGEMTGHGWTGDGWKSCADLREISGEHWGITSTTLLGEKRFDERLPGWEGILWLKITRAAGRRFYLHRALRIYHTEGADRVCRARRSARQRLAAYRCVGQDAEYLCALKETNPRKYRRMVRKVWQGRLASFLDPGVWIRRGS